MGMQKVVILGNLKTKSWQSWYASMSDEKKAEFLEKRRVARRQNKTAALSCVNHAQVTRAHASIGQNRQCRE